jgi:OOP family OmpA-OmpF porin
MNIGHTLTVIGGACLTAALAVGVAYGSGSIIASHLDTKARQALATANAPGVTADFFPSGWPSRHPILHGGVALNEAARARAAVAVAAIPGVGGVHWEDGTSLGIVTPAPPKPLHCQDDVEALLHTRTIRFEEASAAIDPASQGLIDEVAAALRPCLGSVIAITGHTDSSGNEARNVALSRERAEAVQRALIQRGIPADGLRASGIGSSKPIPKLAPTDPANRRIEFSVIETVPLRPTIVDAPGPR